MSSFHHFWKNDERKSGGLAGEFQECGTHGFSDVGSFPTAAAGV
jgi:hypothetical protein